MSLSPMAKQCMDRTVFSTRNKSVQQAQLQSDPWDPQGGLESWRVGLTHPGPPVE